MLFFPELHVEHSEGDEIIRDIISSMFCKISSIFLYIMTHQYGAQCCWLTMHDSDEENAFSFYFLFFNAFFGETSI